VTAIVNAPAAGQVGDVAARAAAAIADALTTRDFDVRDPAQSGDAFLQITNVRGARCELIVYDSGRLDWEYRHHHGGQSDPSVLAAMALHLLGGDQATGTCPPAACDPQLTLKGQVGQTLTDHGMHVRLKVLDKDELLCEVYAEIAVANPALPDRGTVRVSDDGLISWHCQILNPGHPEDGLEIDDATTTLARTLTAAHSANPAL
jgi:hypothetical protein